VDFCSGSSNGANPKSAILVCADGSLKVLWDSQRWGVQFLFNKFGSPGIDGGQIYAPNYDGGVDVYRRVH
jgi:hypothetical protein